jgi:AcrR family transcriptional regulator
MIRFVPKLWNTTIEAHRREVQDAVLDTTAALVAEHGLRSVTMSRIAEETGIGRATLYKYFSGVEAILFAWHERQISRHVAELTDARDKGGGPSEQLGAMLAAYARLSRESHGLRSSELARHLHRREPVARAQRHVTDMIREVVTEGARTGELRSDVPADELTSYCLHAVGAAANLTSTAAVRRLVVVTMAGLRSGSERAEQARPRERQIRVS